jgi:(heptosyl)LPS beta-1,4-glucosyltransferase
MIIHEALPRGRRVQTAVVIEHHFASDLKERSAKDDSYALLWAIRAFHQRRRPKPAWLERAAHLVGDLLVRGAVFRGGLDAIRLSWVVSRYHAQKQVCLRNIQAGKHAALVADFQSGDLLNLFQRMEPVPNHEN